MKVLLLADPSSAHTIKWSNSLNRKGIEVFLFGLSNYDPNQYDSDIHIKVLKIPNTIKAKLDGNFLKLVYIVALPKIKQIIDSFKPNILHAHYAASYGVLGALTGFKPFVISVWGIDIIKFPKISILHKGIIKFALRKADKVLATSKFLSTETELYTNKSIQITPFGIDVDVFIPNPSNSLDSSKVIVGIVKSLEGKYGIDHLIEAYAIVKKKYPDKILKLMLVGGGSLEAKFKQMINKLNLEDSTIFTGHIPFNKVVDYHNKLSIAVYVSTVESFGVSVLESSSCEIPVIVSNLGGLPEVVEDGITGIIVEPQNVKAIAEAIEKLVLDKDLRKQYGQQGREMVINKYDWNKNVNTMIEIYHELEVYSK